jgi:ADP-ribose pyrophosphatase YjhB (NUDIX family)
VGVAVIDNGRLLMVQRGKGARRGEWAVPGGRQEFGETLAETAVREVAEETGIDVQVSDVVWVGDAIDDAEPPAWHYTLIDFRGTPVGGELRAGDDALDARWVPLDEVRNLPLTPTMYDLLDTLGL